MGVIKAFAIIATASAVAVVGTAATDVGAADKQYTVGAPPAAPRGRSSCTVTKYDCGQTCTTAKACVKYGCTKEVAVKCQKSYWKTYDCEKLVDKLVKGGCEKDVKQTYGCNQTVKAKCDKTREVSKACKKTQKYACKKDAPATCTRGVYKQCTKTVKKNAPCTKTYKKEVNCSWGVRYGYDGKPCFDNISYQSTCPKDVKETYDCSFTESYKCTKKVDATCEKQVDSLCKSTEKYQVDCDKQAYDPKGCTRTIKQKFDCNKKVKETVKNGCGKTTYYDALCKKKVTDSKCCAKQEDKKTCVTKFCETRKCY